MDTSNILETMTAEELLASEHKEKRQLGDQAILAIENSVWDLKPLLRYVAQPYQVVPHVWQESTLDCNGHGGAGKTFRAIWLYGIAEPQASLFLDEKGKFLLGKRCYHCMGNIHFYEVCLRNNAWRRFPLGKVISQLVSTFEDAKSRREKQLASIQKGLSFLQEVRRLFSI